MHSSPQSFIMNACLMRWAKMKEMQWLCIDLSVEMWGSTLCKWQYKISADNVFEMTYQYLWYSIQCHREYRMSDAMIPEIFNRINKMIQGSAL